MQSAKKGVKITRVDLPTGATAVKVKAHVMAPKHVRGVRTEVVDPAKEKRQKLPVPPAPPPPSPKANLEVFGLAIYTALKDRVTVYMLQVRKDGMLAHVGIWNRSQTPADHGRGTRPRPSPVFLRGVRLDVVANATECTLFIRLSKRLVPTTHA